jgi:hypothetical protein
VNKTAQSAVDGGAERRDAVPGGSRPRLAALLQRLKAQDDYYNGINKQDEVETGRIQNLSSILV